MGHLFWKFTDGDGNPFVVEPVGLPTDQEVPVRYKGEELCITGFVNDQFTLDIPDELLARYHRGEVTIRPDWMIRYLPQDNTKKPIFNILAIDLVDA
jgi:hypothetical protein